MSDNPKPQSWSEEIHGITALLSRQAARAAGKLNKPLRTTGLRALAERLSGRVRKPLPRWDDLEALDREIAQMRKEQGLLPDPSIQPLPARRKPASASAPQLPPMTPKHSHEAKSGFRQPQRKWDERCATCAGTGFVIALGGQKVDCARCQ